MQLGGAGCGRTNPPSPALIRPAFLSPLLDAPRPADLNLLACPSDEQLAPPPSPSPTSPTASPRCLALNRGTMSSTVHDHARPYREGGWVLSEGSAAPLFRWHTTPLFRWALRGKEETNGLCCCKGTPRPRQGGQTCSSCGPPPPG